MGLALVLASSVWAAGPDEEYVRIYKTMVEADSLRDAGQGAAAISSYQNALAGLQRLQSAHPTWNERLVNFRLNYIANQLRPLGVEASAVPPPMPAPITQQSPSSFRATGVTPVLEPQIQQLREENAALRATAARLEAKVREALTAQPPPTDTSDLVKVKDQLRDLAKENELLKASLEEETRKMKQVLVTNTVVTVVTNRVAVDPPELLDLRKNLTNQIGSLTALKAENEVLKKELAVARTTPPAATPAPAPVPVPNPETERLLSEARQQLQSMQTSNQELQKRQTALEQQLTEGRATQSTLAEKLKRTEELEKNLAEAQSRNARLTDQNQSLERRLTQAAAAQPPAPAPAAAPPARGASDPDMTRRLVKLEKDLLESQSEIRSLGRQKGDLEQKLAAAQAAAAAASGAPAKDSPEPAARLQIIPGAGGEAAAVEVHRQLKQAAWEVLTLQAQNQELLKKQASLEQELVKAGSSRSTFDNIDQDRLRRLEKLNAEVAEAKQKALA
ncbi:MAG TPA: hypothetical protein DCM86_16235, partial [Verrucomicrobiales bacterium]|nr:hypothetical protein [Verrucomicrobiales bacterium]